MAKLSVVSIVQDQHFNMSVTQFLSVKEWKITLPFSVLFASELFKAGTGSHYLHVQREHKGVLIVAGASR